MRLQELKVKRKSLAEEARIIRLERRRAKAAARWHRRLSLDIGKLTFKEQAVHDKKYLTALNTINSLDSHNKHIVRRVARTSHLANGLLRGIPYHDMEVKCRPDNPPNWAAVRKAVLRFGGKEKAAELAFRIDQLEEASELTKLELHSRPKGEAKEWYVWVQVLDVRSIIRGPETRRNAHKLLKTYTGAAAAMHGDDRKYYMQRGNTQDD